MAIVSVRLRSRAMAVVQVARNAIIQPASAHVAHMREIC